MNSLSIALNGLTPGASPLQIATQGLLITIEPAPEQDALWIPLRSFGPPNAKPYDSRKKRKKRIDAVVNVEGVSGTLTCTPANVFELAREARLAPIIAEHCLKYWLWKKRCRQKSEPVTASARAQTAAKTKAKRAADRKAKVLRDDANGFAAALKPSDLPNVARMLYLVTQENRELRKALKKKAP